MHISRLQIKENVGGAITLWHTYMHTHKHNCVTHTENYCSNVLDQDRTWFLPIPGIISSTGYKERARAKARVVYERERERKSVGLSLPLEWMTNCVCVCTCMCACACCVCSGLSKHNILFHMPVSTWEYVNVHVRRCTLFTCTFCTSLPPSPISE